MALQKPGLSNKEELVSGRLKRFLTIGLCCFCMTGECLTAESDEIVLYSNEFSLPGLKMSVADRTIDVVSKAVAPRKLVVKTVSLPELVNCPHFARQIFDQSGVQACRTTASLYCLGER